MSGTRRAGDDRKVVQRLALHKKIIFHHEGKIILQGAFLPKKNQNTKKSSPQHAFELKGCSRGYG